MKRRLVNISAIACTIVGVAIIGVCILTRNHAIYFERDLAYYRGPGDQVFQGLDQGFWQGPIIFLHGRRIEWTFRGAAALAEFHADHPPTATWYFGRTEHWPEIQRRSGDFIWNRLGFNAGKYDVVFSYTREHHRVLAFPAWAVALPALIFGLVIFRRRWIAQRRRRQGRCSRCGYDLRASPARCPECGAAAGLAA